MTKSPYVSKNDDSYDYCQDSKPQNCEDCGVETYYPTEGVCESCYIRSVNHYMDTVKTQLEKLEAEYSELAPILSRKLHRIRLGLPMDDPDLFRCHKCYKDSVILFANKNWCATCYEAEENREENPNE